MRASATRAATSGMRVASAAGAAIILATALVGGATVRGDVDRFRSAARPASPPDAAPRPATTIPRRAPEALPAVSLDEAPVFRRESFDIRTVGYRARWYAARWSVAPEVPPYPTDADGVIVKVIDGEAYYHPVQMAQEGLHLLDSFRQTGDRGFLDRARRIASRLRQEAYVVRGTLFFPYEFDFPLTLHRTPMRAPWFSGMAQGIALSLFVQLHTVTHEPGYRAWAARTFDSLLPRRPGRLPWVSYVDRDENLWIEEYPSERPDHVLNGYVFAAFGLYDWYVLTRDPDARELLEGALTTLRSFGAEYRNPGDVSSYCLRDHVRSTRYHRVHIWQLAKLAELSGDGHFSELSHLFARDAT